MGSDVADVVSDSTSDDWARKIISSHKKHRLEEHSPNLYIDCRWMPATTCEVERLFSKCRHVFSDWRRRMLPETLENIVYLSVNRKWWDIRDVAAIARNVDEDVLEGEEDEDEDEHDKDD